MFNRWSMWSSLDSNVFNFPVSYCGLQCFPKLLNISFRFMICATLLLSMATIVIGLDMFLCDYSLSWFTYFYWPWHVSMSLFPVVIYVFFFLSFNFLSLTMTLKICSFIQFSKNLHPSLFLFIFVLIFCICYESVWHFISGAPEDRKIVRSSLNKKFLKNDEWSLLTF